MMFVCVCCVCVRYDQNADLSDNIDSPRDRVDFLKHAAQILVYIPICYNFVVSSVFVFVCFFLSCLLHMKN